MLYFLYSIFGESYKHIRFFKYITLRALLGFIISLVIVIFVGRPFIKFMKSINIGENIRTVGPKKHFIKKGTPTMGGLIILFSILITNIITGNFSNKFEVMLLILSLMFAAIGFMDDYLKIKYSNKKGLAGKIKLLLQAIIAIFIMLFILRFTLVSKTIDCSLVNPFIKNHYFYLGFWIYFLVVIFIITGTSNSVNLTDGLDGLAIGPIIIVMATLSVIAYMSGNIDTAHYLNMLYIKGSGEILVFLASVIGAGLGFLWYNFYPAQIFMGDTGALTLGGLLGSISIFLKQELLLPIIGFVFVVETLSVILQVAVYKTSKKRILRMAPLHHHFELEGIPETKVTIRIWIIALLFCVLGLIILKIR